MGMSLRFETIYKDDLEISSQFYPLSFKYSYTCSPLLLELSVNILGLACVDITNMSSPAASLCTLQGIEESFWSPDTIPLFRSSCRTENKSLGRRYQRMAEAEGINKP
jgi:hypothetical protein